MTRNGPVRVSLDRLGQPKAGEPTVEMRFVNENGVTEVWLIRKDSLDFEGLKDRVRLAYYDYGVDIRLANQSESIERLQKHLLSHHDEILDEANKRGTDWSCGWSDGRGTQAPQD